MSAVMIYSGDLDDEWQDYLFTIDHGHLIDEWNAVALPPPAERVTAGTLFDIARAYQACVAARKARDAQALRSAIDNLRVVTS